jgi:hypothetical protein
MRKIAPVDIGCSTQQSRKKVIACLATSGTGVQIDHRFCTSAKSHGSKVPKWCLTVPWGTLSIVSAHRTRGQQKGTDSRAMLDSVKDDQRVRSGVIHRPRLKPSVPWWIMSLPGTWITSRWQCIRSSNRLIWSTNW